LLFDIPIHCRIADERVSHKFDRAWFIDETIRPFVLAKILPNNRQLVQLRRRSMRYPQILGVALAASFTSLASPTTTTEANSPKAVVEQFLRIETNGGRTTPEGWLKASAFFARPSSRIPNVEVFVIHDGYTVWDPTNRGTSTMMEINVEFQSEGHIDPSLRFRPIVRRTLKSSLIYKLSHSNDHRELLPEGQPLKEVTGPPEWRIDDSGADLMLDVDTAIRYVT
jgi:hypothetical protein